jgi:hypothetical protein
VATTRKRSNGGRGSKAARRRNYRLEYVRRVQRGLAKGLSRSQSRGHARAGERPRPANPIAVNPKGREETAIRIMKAGFPLRQAAKAAGVPEQHLRRYIKENVGATRVGNRWVFQDQRPRQYPVYSENELKTLVLTPFEASRASQFMHAVRQFISTGDIAILAPFARQGVIDVNGRFHPFEVDPNRLYELDAAGELNFPEFYRIINQGEK